MGPMDTTQTAATTATSETVETVEPVETVDNIYLSVPDPSIAQSTAGLSRLVIGAEMARPLEQTCQLSVIAAIRAYRDRPSAIRQIVALLDALIGDVRELHTAMEGLTSYYTERPARVATIPHASGVVIEHWPLRYALGPPRQIAENAISVLMAYRQIASRLMPGSDAPTQEAVTHQERLATEYARRIAAHQASKAQWEGYDKTRVPGRPAPQPM